MPDKVMRYQGKITHWQDDKGFGFIAWHGGGSPVFIHIKAFSQSSRRPAVGDIVTYELAKDANGRARAELARFSRQNVPKRPLQHRSSAGPIVFIFMFAVFIVASAIVGRIPGVLVAVYGVLSVVTLFAYAWDKSAARLGRWRTRESTLLLMGLAGGWPGALIAQRQFRHKSSKAAFQQVFWATVLLNVAAVGYLVWEGEAGVLNALLTRLLNSLMA